MVFSSIPVYLDPPNWPQQPPGGIAPENSQQLPPRPPPLGSGGGMGSSVRPGSMADQARQAKIPQPEVALKCPRCESTNTKFCYFNNYSLSQPRHFCKTCRRYWTRGGALRNVPVGGGCRRNKRSKSISRLKSPGALNKSVLSNSTCTTDNNDNNIFTGQHILQLPPPSQLPILPPLHHLGEFNSSPDIGLSFAGIQAPVASNGGGGGMEFPMSSNSSSGGVVEQWRLQQFPCFLNNNLDSSSTTTNGFYGTDHVEGVNAISELIARMKTEERNNHDHQHHQGLSLSRDLLGVSSGNIDHYWGGGGNTWTDLPGFTNTSSSTHLMFKREVEGLRVKENDDDEFKLQRFASS